MRSLCRVAAAFLCALTSCSTGDRPVAATEDAAASDVPADAPVDAPSDARVDKAGACASEFGTALTNSFGRADGVVTAVVGPTVTKCALPNSDHVVVQIRMNGAIYRMVVNVASTRGTDLRVRFAAVDHGPLGAPWSEGFHPGVTLDYPTDLGAHTDAFTPYEMQPLADAVEAAIDLGVRVSVYAWSSGGASAHKIHRNGASGDGAIVLDPTGPRPRWLLFHFANQTF